MSATYDDHTALVIVDVQNDFADPNGTLSVRGAEEVVDVANREAARARAAGALAVEMEAAALYAFATARQRPVICFAHVTNTMARSEGDFEKGEADGAKARLAVVAGAARAWSSLQLST